MKKTRLNEHINNFLESNIKRKPVSFHMPGHKYGRFPYGKIICSAAEYDITEIPGADNIKKPSGIIKQSQDGVAEIYGVEKTYFLTNGATSGIHAILRYAAILGKKLILSRDSHLSAVNGAILFNVKTVFMPVYESDGIPLPASAEDVRKCIIENPDACGILVTSPNYYGKTADLKEISNIARRNNMFLAVDEAHGAHFLFCGLNHLSGIENGADIICHSLHKTLPVFNQGALLHVNGKMIDRGKIRSAIDMLGTTSPSYPLLANMEKTIAYYDKYGFALYEKLEDRINRFKKLLEKKTGLALISTDDRSRMVIKTGGNGFTVQKVLHEKYAVDLESADFNNIIAIATPSNRKSDFNKLFRALSHIEISPEKKQNIIVPALPNKKCEPGEACLQDQFTMPLDMAEGRICGTIIVSYPPGIPLVCPGEVIDGYTIEFINKISKMGGMVLGVENNEIPVLEQT